MPRTRNSDRATDIGDRLERLARFTPGQARVVSCYLKLEPRDRARNKYFIKYKNRLRAVEEGLSRLGLGRREEDAVRADLARVTEFLQSPGNLPPTRGVVIFACGAKDLFEVIPVPRVHRSRLGVDRTPLVRELASLDDEVGRILVTVLDRTAARFFVVTAFGVTELDGLRADATRGGRFHGDQNGPGWGEHTYNNRIRTERARHLDAVARRLFQLDRGQRATGLVVAGTGSDAPAIEPFLHPYLADRLLGHARLNPKEATDHEVLEATLDAREAWERDSERRVAAEVAEKVGERWAVQGVEATLRSLARGQVRRLLVDPDAANPGFRCSDTGRLALAERDCRGEGDPEPVLDVVDDAIEEALRQGAAVDVVYDEDARAGVDGLAALLRFR